MLFKRFDNIADPRSYFNSYNFVPKNKLRRGRSYLLVYLEHTTQWEPRAVLVTQERLEGMGLDLFTLQDTGDIEGEAYLKSEVDIEGYTFIGYKTEWELKDYGDYWGLIQVI